MTATAIPVKRTVNVNVTWDGTNEVRKLTWFEPTTTDGAAVAQAERRSQEWGKRQGCEGFTVLSIEVEPPAYIVRFANDGQMIPMALPVGTSRHDAEQVALRTAVDHGGHAELWAGQPHPSGSGITDTAPARQVASIDAAIRSV
jgi:hypothetical protein